MGRIGQVLTQAAAPPAPTSRIGAVLTLARNIATGNLRALANPLGTLHQGVQGEALRLGTQAQRMPTFQSVAPALGDVARRPLELMRLPTGIMSGFAPGTKVGAVARGMERRAQDVTAAAFADELAYGAAGALAKRAIGGVSRIGQALRQAAEAHGVIAPEILPPRTTAAPTAASVVREAEVLPPRRALPSPETTTRPPAELPAVTAPPMRPVVPDTLPQTARVRQLEARLRTIDKAMRTLEQQRTLAVKSGRPHGLIDQRLQTLSQEFNGADANLADILVGNTAELRQQLGTEQTGTVKLGELERIEKTAQQRIQSAFDSGARQSAIRTRQEVIGELQRQFRLAAPIIRAAQEKFMTPSQIGRMAKFQRTEPGQQVVGPRGGLREAPLEAPDVRRITATTKNVVLPANQPTGTPPIIPRSRALITAESPRPVRDLTESQAVGLSGLDTNRAAQIIDNRPFGPTQRQVLEPLRRAELTFRQEQQQTLHQLRAVSQNMPEGGPESRQVFEYLEGRRSAEQMTPRARATAQWMAQQFDQLLERVNQARESIGKRPIFRREGYVTHIQDENVWTAMREAFTNAPDETTKNLHTAFVEQLRGRTPSFRFGLPREGDRAQQDALRAFKTYLPAALRVVHLSTPSRLATVYVNRSLAGTPNAHRYFSQLVRQVATGEQGPIAKAFPRPAVRILNWLKGRFGKGTILGNLSSVLQQPFTLPATIAQNGADASTAAAGWIARGDGMDFAMQWSPTLQARVMEMDVDFTRLSSKWDAAMGAMFAAADKTMVAHAFNSGYMAAVKRGANFQEALEAAEQSAMRTQSSFLTTDMAPIFRDTIAAGLLQFQNTVNGVFNFMAHDIPRGWAGDRLKAAATFVGTFWAMSAIYEGLGLPHPELLSWDTVPGLSTVRSGGPSNLRLLKAFTQIGDPDPRRRAEAQKTIWRIVVVTAGGAGANQAYKSIQGAQAVGRGGKYDKRGRLQFRVQGLPEQARAVAFGPYGTRAGEAYIKRGFRPEPLSDSEKRLNRLRAARRRAIRPAHKDPAENE